MLTNANLRDEDASSWVEAERPNKGVPLPRHTRRLSDKILVAFHHACDTNDLEVAEQLLRVMEHMMTRRPNPAEGNRRRSMESLVAAHERIWHIRHPEPEG